MRRLGLVITLSACALGLLASAPAHAHERHTREHHSVTRTYTRTYTHTETRTEIYSYPYASETTYEYGYPTRYHHDEPDAYYPPSHTYYYDNCGCRRRVNVIMIRPRCHDEDDDW